MLRRISLLITGSAKSSSLEHRFHNATNFVVGLSQFLAMIANATLNLPWQLIAYCLLFSLIGFFLFYLGRIHKQDMNLRPWTVLLILVSSFVGYWMNGASTGGVQYYWSVGALSCVILISPKYRWVLFLWFPIAITVLLFGEWKYPEWVLPYTSRESRFTDICISFISSILMALLCGMVLIDNFRLFRRLLNLETIRRERLLRHLLPSSIAQRLIAGEQSMADNIEDATVIFIDIVQFTPIVQLLPATKLIDDLRAWFKELDRLAKVYEVEKIKTIGDAFMGAAGLAGKSTNHANSCVLFAQASLNAAQNFHLGDHAIRLHIGVHSGPVTAGIVGTTRVQYDLWGSTVNIASRLQGSAPADTIQISDVTHSKLPEESTGEMQQAVEIKGLGPIKTWILSNAP